MHGIRFCFRCGKNTLQEVVKQICASGVEQIGWQCQQCNQWTGDGKYKNYWLNHKSLTEMGVDISALRIVGNPQLQRCCVCGALGAELHHWAPQCLDHLFDEPANWPTAYLCKPHHDEWHRIVTPDLETLKKQTYE